MSFSDIANELKILRDTVGADELQEILNTVTKKQCTPIGDNQLKNNKRTSDSIEYSSDDSSEFIKNKTKTKKVNKSDSSEKSKQNTATLISDDRTTSSQHNSQNKNNNMSQSTATIPTKNRFTPLGDDEISEDEMDQEDSTEIKKSKPLPIVVNIKGYTPEYNKEIKNEIKQVAPEVNLKYKQNQLIFLPIGKINHNLICNKLEQLKIPFHTYAEKGDKPKKYVIKGLMDMSIDDIEIAIQDHGISPIKVSKLNTKIATRPIYFVAFAAEMDVSLIKQIKYIDHVCVKWHKYKNPKKLTQCYTCQVFGHGSSHCRNKPRCVKCAEQHLAKDCPIQSSNKDKTTHKLKCANCGKEHPASFTGCECYQKQLKTIQEKRSTATKGQHQPSGTPTTSIFTSKQFPQLKNTDNAIYIPTHQLNTNNTYAQVTNNNNNNNNTEPNEQTNHFKELKDLLKEIDELTDLKQFITELKELKIKLKNAQSHERKLIIAEYFLNSSD